ncbi:hypothetical protein F4859DRAFT_517323 [Xylaria cf. heliscus]|nr:hypothetical protein F4859DRAFT_517323 [Xylaria cf. heliscus]
MLSIVQLYCHQVRDADYNTYKEFLVAGKAFIKAMTLAKYSPLDRLGVLADFIDMMSGWGMMYDFSGTWKQIINAGLNQQVASERTQLASYITDQLELAYW